MNSLVNKNIPVNCAFLSTKTAPSLVICHTSSLRFECLTCIISWQSTITDHNLLLQIKKYSPFTAVGSPGALGSGNSTSSCSNTKGLLKQRFWTDRALILIMTNCLRIQHFSYAWPFCSWNKVIYVPENCSCALIWYLYWYTIQVCFYFSTSDIRVKCCLCNISSMKGQRGNMWMKCFLSSVFP